MTPESLLAGAWGLTYPASPLLPCSSGNMLRASLWSEVFTFLPVWLSTVSIDFWATLNCVHRNTSEVRISLAAVGLWIVFLPCVCLPWAVWGTEKEYILWWSDPDLWLDMGLSNNTGVKAMAAVVPVLTFHVQPPSLLERVWVTFHE